VDTAVSMPNKEPLELEDFGRGVSRITAELGLAERMLRPSILALSSRCCEREGNLQKANSGEAHLSIPLNR